MKLEIKEEDEMQIEITAENMEREKRAERLKKYKEELRKRMRNKIRR